MKKTHANTLPPTAPAASRQRAASRLPSLDALKVFEAAARHLSFTRAAGELAVTQSAVSRAIKTVEDGLGVALFNRYNRRLELTEAGERLARASGRALAEINASVAQITGTGARVVTVTTPLSFASLWLVPRLASFRARHPEIDVRLAANDNIVSLERERIDCAIRFCEPEVAPAGALQLIREEAFPVVSPLLLRDKSRPLAKPADLARHVLLHYDDPQRRVPWVEWSQWLSAWKIPDLVPAGSLTFSHYDQVIAAAVEGDGVAIGRMALVQRLIRQKKLVVPFGERLAGARQYFVITSRASRTRPELQAFIAWAIEEAARDVAE